MKIYLSEAQADACQQWGYEFENIKIPALPIIGQLDRTAMGKNLVSEEERKTLGYYPALGKWAHEKIKGS